MRSKRGGKLSVHFCGDHETAEVVFRTVISGNHLGSVADMCEELASSISDYPASTGKSVAEEKPETMVSSTDLLPTRTPLLTDGQVQGDIDART